MNLQQLNKLVDEQAAQIAKLEERLTELEGAFEDANDRLTDRVREAYVMANHNTKFREKVTGVATFVGLLAFGFLAVVGILYLCGGLS